MIWRFWPWPTYLWLNVLICCQSPSLVWTGYMRTARACLFSPPLFFNACTPIFLSLVTLVPLNKRCLFWCVATVTLWAHLGVFLWRQPPAPPSITQETSANVILKTTSKRAFNKQHLFNAKALTPRVWCQESGSDLNGDRMEKTARDRKEIAAWRDKWVYFCLWIVWAGPLRCGPV